MQVQCALNKCFIYPITTSNYSNKRHNHYELLYSRIFRGKFSWISTIQSLRGDFCFFRIFYGLVLPKQYCFDQVEWANFCDWLPMCENCHLKDPTMQWLSSLFCIHNKFLLYIAYILVFKMCHGYYVCFDSWKRRFVGSPKMMLSQKRHLPCLY